MSSSDDDDDDLLLQPVKIGGVDLGLNEDEIMAPSLTAESVEYEPVSPSKALASKNLVAPDSGNSRHFSQESDSSSPAPGKCHLQTVKCVVPTVVTWLFMRFK